MSYAWPGNEAERECVYGGHIGGSHDDYAMRGGGRRPRQERLTWTLYLRVVRPDLSSVECAQRALTLGASIEEAIAAAAVHSGAGVDGMKAIGVSGFELQNFADDDSRGAEIKYSIEFLSVIA